MSDIKSFFGSSNKGSKYYSNKSPDFVLIDNKQKAEAISAIEKTIGIVNAIEQTRCTVNGVVRNISSTATGIRNQFKAELNKWLNSNDSRKFDLKARKAYAEYLTEKYMCGLLDTLNAPSYRNKYISQIRKEIITIIDKLATDEKFDYLDSISNSNSNSKENIQITINEYSGSDSELKEGDLLAEDLLEEDNSLIPVDNINLCFVGGVSTGKSTVLNGIFCEELTQCKIKRTTMVPTVYVENESNIDLEPDEIFRQISEKNKEIIEQTELGQKLDKSLYKELVFNVGKLDINILEGSYVNVYDIPGLNDARTKDIYYDYLDTNFHKFNLVVFLVDIHSGLNTSDEMDMLKFITNNTREQFENNGRQIYTLVVVNKADDMRLDEDTSLLEITGELKEMYEQVENTITREFALKNVAESLIGIIPLCAIDAYLYRMVKKHGCDFKLSPEQILKIGVNENGKKFSTLKPAAQETRVYDILKDQVFIDTMIKLSGFSRLESILHNFLQQNNKGSKLRVDNLLYELKKLPKLCDITFGNSWFNVNQMLSLVQQYCKIYDNIRKIDKAEYNAIVTSFVAELTTILKQKVKSWSHYTTNITYANSITSLIDAYNKFIEVIINPYFRDYYNVAEYPAFLTDHVISMVHGETANGLTIDGIIKHLHILIKINMFTKENIEQLFNKIVTNVRAENTVTFSKGNNDISRLTQLLDQSCKIGAGLSEFLRFLIINQLSSLEGDIDLYVKGLLYEKYGELPIRNYINTLDFKNRPTIQQIVRGLKAEDFEDNELDLYYLKYEQENNSVNFTNV